MFCPRSAFYAPKNPFSRLVLEVRTSALSPQHPFPPCPWVTSLGPFASHPKTQPFQHPLATAPFPTAPTVSGGTLRPQKRRTTVAFPTQGNRLALLPQTGGRSWGGGTGGQGRPRRRRAQTQCCHSRGCAVGPGPSCPDTIGAAPRATCVHCGPAAPPAPPFCPPSDNGSALCAWLDKDFVSEKETVFVCQKRSAKKGTGRSGGCSGAASLAAPRSIGLARPPLRHP